MRINEFSGSKLSFSHHTERKRSASYRNKVEMLHICESKCFSRLRPAGYAVPSLARRFMKRTFGA